MNENSLSRRSFLGVSAAAAGASLVGGADSPLEMPGAAEAPAPRPARTPPPSDRVRFGIVGVGMQGSSLLGESIKLSGVECVAACDLYDGRHQLAREITNNPSLRVTRRYQELLDDKNIDAIVAAVPDHWHRKIVVDAVGAGKDIYIEKPMSHSPADGVAMVDAVKKSGRILQVGSQRVSSPICAKAREMISQGMLGDLTMVEASLGRNDPSGAWQYPPPPDLSPANLDWDTWLGTAPKKPFDPILFARWRAWKDYGTGVAGDLLVHLISGMLFMLDRNEPPTRAMAVGGIRRWKDGRDTPDVHITSYYYGDLPVSMRLNLGTWTPEMYRFQGSKGVLELQGNNLTFTAQTGQDMSPSYYDGSFPKAMREAYEKQWHQQNDQRLAREGMGQTITYRGTSYDALPLHLQTFYDAVRTRKPVVEDVTFGHNAALACHMANESYFRNAIVSWDPNAKAIRSAGIAN